LRSNAGGEDMGPSCSGRTSADNWLPNAAISRSAGCGRRRTFLLIILVLDSLAVIAKLL
jgi:hypothetical protein